MKKKIKQENQNSVRQGQAQKLARHWLNICIQLVVPERNQMFLHAHR